MDLEMFINLFIYILALFGVILILFLFVKLVLWCLMCDIDTLDARKMRLEFELNRIEEAEINQRINVQNSTYQKAPEPVPDTEPLRRSPEIERLNSENLLNSDKKLCDYSSHDSNDSGDEIFIEQEIEKVIRDAESPPVQYAEINHERKTSCLKQEQALKFCVCPFCSKGAQAKEPTSVVTIETTETDHVSIKIEKDDQESKDQIQVETAEKLEKFEEQNVKSAFQELDYALGEIDEIVIELINENQDTDNSENVENVHVQNRSETITEPEQQDKDDNNNVENCEQNDVEEKQNSDDQQAVENSAHQEQDNSKDNQTTETTDSIPEEKPKPPEKPKTFLLRTATKSQPQCVTYSQVVKQLKQRNSQLINPSDVPS